MKEITKFIKDVAPLLVTVIVGTIVGTQLNNRFVEPKLAKSKPVFTPPVVAAEPTEAA